MEKKKDQPACLFQPHISVNNSRSFSITPNVPNVGKAASGGRVLITPLKAHQPLLPQRNAKVFLKAVSKEKKSHTKTFKDLHFEDLHFEERGYDRHYFISAITSSDCLKKTIRAQLNHTWHCWMLDVGCWICSRYRSELKSSSKLILWCEVWWA